MMNLDQLVDFTGKVVYRQNWMEKPDLPEECYYYNPTYGLSGLLLYNYEETDYSLRKRIKELTNCFTSTN